MTKWQEDVLSALDRLKVSLKCTACNGRFEVMPSPITRQGEVSNGPSSPPFVILNCNNCGKIRQHSPLALGVTP